MSRMRKEIIIYYNFFNGQILWQTLPQVTPSESGPCLMLSFECRGTCKWLLTNKHGRVPHDYISSYKNLS